MGWTALFDSGAEVQLILAGVITNLLCSVSIGIAIIGSSVAMPVSSSLLLSQTICCFCLYVLGQLLTGLLLPTGILIYMLLAKGYLTSYVVDR